MGVETKHPSYSLHVDDWEACRDVYEGESAVKQRDNGHRYLPPTTGQRIDWDTGDGKKSYESYLKQALLPGFFSDAVDFYLGMLWHRPPLLELGPLEQVFGDGKPATSGGESLLQLLRRIHVEQLVAGRVGIFADMPAEELSTPQPYLELYEAESIINWDDGARDLARRKLNLVVLNESGQVRDGEYDWKPVERYRVLQLGALAPNEDTGTYSVKVVDRSGKSEEGDSVRLVQPTVRQKALDQIPFVFCGTKGITTRINKPPLLPLARGVLALLRLDADHRQELHISGQDTLVTRGATDDEATAVGAGAKIAIANPAGDAKFIGVSGKGLTERREQIQADQALCAKRAGELLADNSKQRESGESLVMRTGTKSASILDIAETSAEALQAVLRIIAKWLGAAPAAIEQIKVEPNRTFATPSLVPDDLLKLMQAYIAGAPIRLQDIHEYNVKHGGTTLSWDDLVKGKREEKRLVADLLPALMGAEEDEDEPQGGSEDE